MMKTLEMPQIVTGTNVERTPGKNEIHKKNLYAPILKKIEYWRDYTGTGELYRKEHDFDCLLTGGNLLADTLFSLWLPLRYTLNYYSCNLWNSWKEFEAEKLRPQKLGLKDCTDFLNELIDNIEVFLPPEELTTLLSELFELGQQRCNVIILPYRSWNSMRGCKPYYDYMPHFLYYLMNTESSIFLMAVSAWVKREYLEMFFNGSLDKCNLKDLADTGAVWRHSPDEINVKHLLRNYIDILRTRKSIMMNAA